ncbi:protein kinase [Streptomyces sp. 184]|uniref:protein kinase n=1 Tax=Streptomyces sp. 184 TaxID=1827526 RepID=UPI003891DDCF
MDDYAGRVLADRYRLPAAVDAEPIHTRAFDTYSGQDVLIGQVPLPEIVEAELIEDGGGADPSGYGDGAGRSAASVVVQRAMDAARAAAAIPDHPRLAQVFDVFEEGGSLWIVSELVPARTLEGLLEERPLSPYRGAEVAADILTALRALHAHGWTHRNITTRTVLVCDDGRVVLTGLASGAAEEALCGYDPLPPPPGRGEPPRPTGSPGPRPGETPLGPDASAPGLADPSDGRLPQLPDPATGFLPAAGSAGSSGSAGQPDDGVLPPGWSEGPGPYGRYDDGSDPGANARGGAGPYGTPPYDEDDEVWRSAPYGAGSGGSAGDPGARGAQGGSDDDDGHGARDDGSDRWPFGAWQQGGPAPGGRGHGPGGPGGGQAQQPYGSGPQGGRPGGPAGGHSGGQPGGHPGGHPGGQHGGAGQSRPPAGQAPGGPGYGHRPAAPGAGNGAPGQPPRGADPSWPAGQLRGGAAPAGGGGQQAGGQQAGDQTPAARAGVMAAYQAGTRAAEARLAAGAGGAGGAGGPGVQAPGRPTVPGQSARTPEAGQVARPGGAVPAAGAAGPRYSDRIDIGGDRPAQGGPANPAPQAAGSPDVGAPWDDLPNDAGEDGYDEYGTADAYGTPAPASPGAGGASARGGPGGQAAPGPYRAPGAPPAGPTPHAPGSVPPGTPGGPGGPGGGGPVAGGHGSYGGGRPGGGPGSYQGGAPHGGSGPPGPGPYGGPGGPGASHGPAAGHPPGGSRGPGGAPGAYGGPGGPGGPRGPAPAPSRGPGAYGAPGGPGSYGRARPADVAEPEPRSLPDSLPGGASYGGSLPGVRPGASIAVPVGAEPVPAARGELPGPETGGAPRYPGPSTRLAAERARQTRMQVVGAVTERWAPEQAGPIHEHWQLAPPVGPAADLWALGALLFRAVQGHSAYPEEDVGELVQLVCSEPPAHAEECGALRPVVESLLRQDPTERPDFEELRGWLRSLIRTAPEPGIGSRTVTVPQQGTGRGGDPRRLPILRRRGELMRRRRTNKAPVPVHARHKRRARRGPRGPRSLGRTLIALIFVAMAGAIAYAAMFMPEADESGRDQQSVIGAGRGDEPRESGAPPADSGDPNEPEERRQQKESDDPDKPEDGDRGGGAGSELPDGFVLREDPAGFEVAVREDWQRVGENENGQVRYDGGDYELVVVPGRDGVGDFGSDPMAYQQQGQPELDEYRDSAWAQADGLRRIEVGQRVMAEGEFDWTDGSGRQVHARNLAMIWDDSYHVVLLIGPSGEGAEVERFHRIAAESYRPTG